MKQDVLLKKQQIFEDEMPLASTQLQEAQHFDELEELLSHQEDLASGLDNKPKRRWSWLAKAALGGIISLVALEWGLSLFSAWQQSPWLFGFYALVSSLVSLFAASIVFKEWRQLKQLRGVEEAQQVSERLALSMQMGEAEPFIEDILSRAPQDIDLSRYRQHLSEEHNDAERVLLFESTVLTQIDAKAKKLVHRYALESAVLLAASPIAVLDMAIILWRNQKMIRELARCYGIELGYWSRIKLIRSVILNIIYAGTSEVVTDIGTQLLSLEVSGKVSARMAQGLGGGLLTARLGYQTMALCRPVGFSHETKPKLTKIHRALLSELKDFSLEALSKKSKKPAEKVKQ
ncbi:YcjF family protein [Shewanella sp. AS1]|uniref:YcjF family protein n=1 Tax=Shewanella sp. AS1 TaxID=2907626 RepID=UPI001F19F42C|nr:TIGR01620 family protein [Shewanella sp. AS1]MCE9678259.1 YcjF family protein [Shewanella sp. AS1]